MLEVEHRVLGNEHPNALASSSDLAATFRAQGKYREAEVLVAEVRETPGCVGLLFSSAT